MAYDPALHCSNENENEQEAGKKKYSEWDAAVCVVYFGFKMRPLSIYRTHTHIHIAHLWNNT